MTISIPLVTLPDAGTGQDITGRLPAPGLRLALSRPAVLALVSPTSRGSQPAPPGRPRDRFGLWLRNAAAGQADALLRRARRRGDRAEARRLFLEMRALPSTDPMDPGYRRLKYIRYADDHILGFTGLKAEAEEIKARLAEFLRETLGLELNQQKTLITHARSQRARFLGYDITVQHSGTKISNGRRSANGKIALKVPPDVIRPSAPATGTTANRGTGPGSRTWTTTTSSGLRAEYRGVVNYYLLAKDAWRLRTLRWNAETSMLKTLAAKHQSTVSKMAARHKAKAETGDGPRTCFEARRRRRGKPDLVARFGGIILRQDRRAVITEPVPVRVRVPRRELLARLRQRECELCETGTTVAVHQVAGIRELGNRRRASPRGPPSWRKCGARRSSSAHRAMTGSTRTRSRTRHKSLESRMPGKRHVRFGGRLPGKGPVHPE